MSTPLIFGFLISTFLCLLIIRYQHLHAHLTTDGTVGPQKFHCKATPRVGGVPIFISMVFVWIYIKLSNEMTSFDPPLLFAAMPVFFMGLMEDLTKKIGVKLRLLAAFVSRIIAFYFFEAKITSLDVPYVDMLLSHFWIALLFTAFAIAGVSNAYNIIDGFNGLASIVGVISLFAISFIALQVNDLVVFKLCVAMIVCILGFFIWNYPKGLIFLGDGGAYLIGFWVATLSVLIVARNPLISPWFALLVNAYPITETLFTIWRRSIHQGKNPGLPDAAHFHSLIYRKLTRWATPYDAKVHQKISKNAKTSPYLWIISSLGVIPALMFWDSTPLLMISCVLYALFYMWCYKQVVSLKPSKILIIK
jgi:UDP-N-acetylmuramyl pentapeptide phosphotransferase/UDP-N-acetylglucosamine-1-phosphate transferase